MEEGSGDEDDFFIMTKDMVSKEKPLKKTDDKIVDNDSKIDETKSKDVTGKENDITPTPTPNPTPNPDADEEKIEINDGNDLKEIKSFFKKIKIPSPSENNVSNPPENYIDSYGLFLCYKKNDITNEKCESGKEICLKCIKKAQKMYGLKPHYLINSMGRVCTYKNKKMYCRGKFCRIEFENKIQYHIDFVCGHSGQCDSCKALTQYMKGYFGEDLMNKLKKRDEALM